MSRHFQFKIGDQVRRDDPARTGPVYVVTNRKWSAVSRTEIYQLDGRLLWWDLDSLSEPGSPRTFNTADVIGLIGAPDTDHDGYNDYLGASVNVQGADHSAVVTLTNPDTNEAQSFIVQVTENR